MGIGMMYVEPLVGRTSTAAAIVKQSRWRAAEAA